MTIKFEPTAADLKDIEEMAEQGLPIERIAAYYEMSEDVFSNFRKKNVKLRNAIKYGKARGDRFLCGQLWQGVRDGNMTSIIFASKVRLHMSERPANFNQALQTNQKTDKINFKAMTPVEAARVYQKVMKGD